MLISMGGVSGAVSSANPGAESVFSPGLLGAFLRHCESSSSREFCIVSQRLWPCGFLFSGIPYSRLSGTTVAENTARETPVELEISKIQLFYSKGHTSRSEIFCGKLSRPPFKQFLCQENMGYVKTVDTLSAKYHSSIYAYYELGSVLGI